MDTKNLNDFRRLKSKLHYMISRKIQIAPGNILTIKGLQKVINLSLENAFYGTSDRNNFIWEMESYTAPMIDASEFDWFKNNNRACTLVWLLIRQIEEVSNQPIFEPPNIPLYNQPNQLLLGLPTQHFYNSSNKTYDLMGLKKNTINSAERYEENIKFFDNYNMDNNSKINYLNQLKEQCSKISSTRFKIKWLNKNKQEYWEWAWNYLLNAEQPILHYQCFTPIDNKEKFYALQACIDIDSESLLTQNFINKINHAHSQKKFRDKEKSKNKIPLNTYIKKNTKSKLKELAAKQEINITEMIDRLINQAYKELV